MLMFFYEIIFAAHKFPVYGIYIFNKLVFIIHKAYVKEPKRTMLQRKLLYNLCA